MTRAPRNPSPAGRAGDPPREGGGDGDQLDEGLVWASDAEDPAPRILASEEDDEGPPASEPGEELAPGYEVIEHLSRGDALDVYDVWSRERSCRCAVKVLRPDRRTHERTRRRLLTEGHLLEQLTHPHLVRAYETIEEPDPIVILETLTGETLSYTIARRARRLALLELAYLGLHLCSAVEYLHGQGYLHLDLKPSNIMSACGIAKVLDLSLSSPPGERKSGAGTRAYMAPEQARGGYVDTPADLWGIGAVLYEAAAGRPPFELEEDGPKYPQLTCPADPIRRHRRLPQEFAAQIDACLALEPSKRPSVQALASALEAFTEYGRRGRPEYD